MTTRYINSFRLPKSVGAGRVLCHNHVQHGPNTPCGVNGFRAWTDSEVPSGFVKCRCKWSGLPHYALADHVAQYGKDGKRKSLNTSPPRTGDRRKANGSAKPPNSNLPG